MHGAIRGSAPRASRWLILLILLLPILAGLGVSLLGSFGVYLGLDDASWGWHIWREAMSVPGLGKSVALTLWTSLCATFLALILAFALAENIGRVAPRLVNAIIATPHAAIASGLAFLIAPSGWIVRALGFDMPLQMRTLYDPYGIGLILGLTAKEIPFLLMVSLTASAQIGSARYVVQARSLGMKPAVAWAKAALPLIYPLIRLPVYAVLAFAMSNVDMASILGPNNPPSLAVLIKRMVYSPDLHALLPASALSILLIGLTGMAIGLWRLAEIGVAKWGRAWIARGGSGRGIDGFAACLRVFAKAVLVMAGFGLFCLMIWSISWRWAFPDLVPSAWSLKNWQDLGDWMPSLWTSFVIAFWAVLIGLVLAIIWLEASPKKDGFAIYLPLILPQLSFLFGVNLIFLQTGWRYGIVSVIAAHILFVFPYILITLGHSWRQFDKRVLIVAASFGDHAWARLWRVKLPMLLRPILLAAAVGFAVSIAQYLPTLFLGAGRVETLVTEAVTLSSSGDRRLIGIFGVLQMLLPLCAFWLAMAIPRWLFRNRKAMNPK